MNDVGTLLAIGTDQFRMTVCLLEPVEQAYRLVAWQAAEREPGLRTVSQIGRICQELELQQGRRLWDAELRAPFLQSPDPVRYPPIGQVFAAASPKPRLRVWLTGISEEYSLRSATLAVRSSPANVVGYTQLGYRLSETQLGNQFAVEQPDAVVIAGGFDASDPMAIYALEQLGRMVSGALLQLAPVQRPSVVFAGNRWAAEPTALIFEEAGISSSIQIVPNVQPHAYMAAPIPLVHGLTTEYWRGCRRLSEYREIGGWLRESSQLSSLEHNFARLVQAWLGLHDLTVLHGMYQAPGWWMHVLAQAGQEAVEISFSTAESLSPLLSDWPAPQLVSGPWPHQWWAPPEQRWHDLAGLAPIMASIGYALPEAMIQVLELDIFI